MPDPLITVLMAAYNGGDYLKFSVESVLRQTYQDFEFLIIDDFGSDDSLRCVESLKDSRIRIHRNAVNLGQTRSLNIGLKLALGEYVARIDADDLAFPTWLETQFSFIKKNPRYAAVSARAVVIDSSNRIKKILNSPLNFEDVIFRSLTASPVNHVGVMMRKDLILNETGGYDERLKIAADYEMWSTLLRKGHRIISTPSVSMAIRVHRNSLSRTENKTELAEVSQIIYKNIQSFTTFPITPSQSKLIADFFYASSRQSFEDFQSAQTLLENAYKNFKLDFLSSPKPARFYRRKTADLIGRIYAKKILENSKITPEEMRKISVEYTRRYGFLNIFALLFVFSFLGNSVVKNIPSWYEQIRVMWTKSRLTN